MENTESNKNNRTIWIVGIVSLVILSIGAAFVGGRLLKERSESTSTDEFGIEVEESEEIPQTEPEANGIVTKVDGDTLTIQEFNMNDTLGVSGEGGVHTEFIEIEIEEGEDMEDVMPVFLGEGGPQIEVIMTHNTKIYKDLTFSEMLGMVESDPSGEMPEMPEIPEKVEMKVELSSADKIGMNSFVTIWGTRSGDRVIADFILFQPGMVFEGNQVNP